MMPSNTDSLHVVMASAEAVPYAKVGGLADVVGSLPRALEKLGVRVTILLPAYGQIHHDKFGIRPLQSVPPFQVPLGPGSARAQLFHTRLPMSEVDVYLIGCPEYFDRDGIYDDPATKEGYPDNLQRFVFFVKACIEAMLRIGVKIDVVHCHDSQTGLIPGFFRTTLASEPFFARTGTLFTIHNLAYQGLFPREALFWAGVDSRFFYPESPFEYWGQVNFMKIGIECADLLTTVSQTYANEIQSDPAFGNGLEGVLRARRQDLFGIVNGIDYSEWNPESDPHIPAHFSAEDLSGKVRCKEELLKIFNLPAPKSRTPLIGIVSRLADQKGLDLLALAMEDLMRLDLQMIVLGTGQRKYHEMLQHFSARYPQKLAVKLGFDNALAHQIEAGCDMFLMPSKYEPCGLNQIYSLRYGTIPIVRATGGLADTVVNYNLADDSGTGFRFVNYTETEMLICVRRALMLYSDPERWRMLMVRSMSEDWSWENSAGKYLELYRRIHERNHAS